MMRAGAWIAALCLGLLCLACQEATSEGVDAAPRDAYTEDAAPRDADVKDAAPGDAAPRDADVKDADTGDAAPRDADMSDAAPGDAAPSDAAPVDEGWMEVIFESPIDATPIPLTIYAPEGLEARPAVLFLHGFLLERGLYASYGAQLREAGYVVIMPQLPGGPFDGISHAALKDHLVALLNAIEAREASWMARVDLSWLGVVGHSMGGKLALLLAAEDERPKAIFGIDPVDTAGPPGTPPSADYPSVTPERMSEIDAPMVLMGERTNATCAGNFCQACAPEAENFEQYALHATSRVVVKIEALGASHMSFLDEPDCGIFCALCPRGVDDPAQTRALTQRYMALFFNALLAAQPLDALESALALDAASGLIEFEIEENPR
ncbi:alpha/beta fold hydrolase [Myxococcota bacterium]|nr:alpha/beta fold hydrolase [Myxococcota bacterium]MBU1899640.1 alpha/beta fold hydrolase [Myxococcota bacterium]